MADLATTADVAGVLGRALSPAETARAGMALTKLSALFRRAAQRKFAEGETTVRLKSNGGRIHLAERPIEAVAAVVDDHGVAVAYRRAGQWLTTPLTSAEFATVTYAHGGEVPDLVRTAMAEAAAQIATFDPSSIPAGAQKVDETAGPFRRSVTYATWASTGRAALSDEDKALARSFRSPVPRLQVSVP